MTTFRIRLRNLCAGTFKTMKQICAEAGIKQSSMKTWMTTDAMPNSKNLILLCKYFGVSADWLLGMSDIRRIKRSNDTD